MKKILFVLSSMNIGGVEKSLLSLLSIMSKEKFDITILLLEKKGGFLDSLPDWVRVEEAHWYEEIKPAIMQPPQLTLREYFNNGKLLKMLEFGGIYYISKKLNDRYLFYKHVFKNIKKDQTRYDIAVCYQGPTDILDYFVAYKVNAAQKVSWIHFDVTKHIINEKLYTRLYSDFDKLLIVSKKAKESLISILPLCKEKADVFYNIVPYDLIKDMSSDPLILDQDFEGLKIVTVGRLSIEKGQDLAIKVLAKLKQNGYNVRWYCIGEGNDRQTFEELIDIYGLKEEFILYGSTSNPYPLIAQADLYVQTSRHEGYCLTLAEAKCLKKPIITTNFIGAYEQIKDGYNGFIVEDSEEELYKKIQYLIETPNVKNMLVDNLNLEFQAIPSQIDKLVNI
ncbi:glycosyltransferase [Bacillus sp. AK128]